MASNGRHKHTAEPENSTTRASSRGREVQSQNAFQLQIKASLAFSKNVVDHNVGHDDKNSLNLTTMSVILIPDNDGVDQHDDDADYQEDDW